MEIYTDGAYSSSRNQGGIGIVFVKEDNIIATYNCGFKNTTNNKMELTAVIYALKAIIKPIKSLTIYTDSMYFIGCATMGWKRNKNRNLWKVYDDTIKQVPIECIKFMHVKGHADNKYNNLADTLAVEASHLCLLDKPDKLIKKINK